MTVRLGVGGGDLGRRMLRGGSWVDVPESLRSAYRYGDNADYQNYFGGFRIAKTLNP